MEFEDVSEEIKSGALRVAVAFGVVKYELVNYRVAEYHTCNFHGPTSSGIQVEWELSEWRLWGLERRWGLETLWVNGDWAMFYSGDQGEWTYDEPSQHPELVMRGLYCLGFDEDDLRVKLRSSLSAHEKLELRLSMPHEFWPKTWLDEEGE